MTHIFYTYVYCIRIIKLLLFDTKTDVERVNIGGQIPDKSHRDIIKMQLGCHWTITKKK